MGKAKREPIMPPSAAELDPRDLEDLQALADRIEALQLSEPSIYSQCGEKPSWPTFEEYWNSL